MAKKQCTSCADKPIADIPYIVHETEMARIERQLKRLWITILILIGLLVGSNAAWLYYENQFEDVVTTQEVTQDAENGTNNFIGGDFVGETNDKNNN